MSSPSSPGGSHRGSRSWSRRAAALAVAASIVLAACGSSDDEDAGPVAQDGMICTPTSVEPTTKAPAVSAITEAPAEVTQKDLEKGDGCAVGQLPFANLNLVGAKADGTVFVDTWASGRPLSLDPATGGLLPALSTAIADLEVGGIRQVVLPAADAYGADGNEAQGIGPDEPLTFVVELFSVTKAPVYCREVTALPEGTRPGKPTAIEMPVEAPTELSTEDLEPGTGDPVETGNFVKIEYVGVACSTGDQFDSSWDREATLDFTVGQDMIDGMTEGIIGAKKGALRKIVIPSDLGYGPAGRAPSIGPNEPLVFVIRVVDVLPEDPTASTTTTVAGATTTTAAGATTTTGAP